MNERFVAPLPPAVRHETATIDALPYLPTDIIHVGQPLAAHHGATEQTSAMDRSLGWATRMGVYAVIVLILSITLVKIAGGGWVLAFCLFAGLSLVLFVVMDNREYVYSRNGLERHKVDTLADLKEKEMDQAHELRKMLVEFQIEQARGRYALNDQGGEDHNRGTVAHPQRRIASRD